MGGEIGVKTVVYNAKRDKNKRGEKKRTEEKKEKKSTRLKKYNSKKKELCTLDHTTRA